MVAFIFSSFLSESQMHSYGWRLCFVIGMVMSLLMLLISSATATFVVTINELFPTHLRFSGVATGYNVSNTLLGGTVPLVSSILIVYFGHMAPQHCILL